MNGALTATLLYAAVGVALAFTPPRARIAGLALLVIASVAGLALRVPPAFAGAMHLTGWLSVIAWAAAVHLPRGVKPVLAMALSLEAGLCSGMLIALGGHWPHLPLALAGALTVVPATFAVRRRLAIAPKVAASWLIAIAVLAAALPFLPVTPGYLPDHLE